MAVLVTPVAPSATGSGLAMRAWSRLLELSADYDVHVLVVRNEMPSEPAAPACSVIGLPISGTSRARPAAPAWPTVAEAALDEVAAGIGQVELLVVFRMRLHLVGQQLRRRLRPARAELDLDDIESSTRASLTADHLRAGRLRVLPKEASDALRYAYAERRLRADYAVVELACSQDTSRGWLRRWAAQVAVRSNRVDAPAGDWHAAAGAQGAVVRLLFVGSLGYGPNDSAARWIAGPLTRALRRRGLPFRAQIVGRSPHPSLVRRLAAVPEVTLTADAESLEPYYYSADIVLVPVRAGGGTKIKTIEAIAHHRPVVGFPHAVRGLPLTPGRHYLRCRSARGAARAITRLAADPVAAAAMAADARSVAAPVIREGS